MKLHSILLKNNYYQITFANPSKINGESDLYIKHIPVEKFRDYVESGIFLSLCDEN